jgi:hypothetical protein
VTTLVSDETLGKVVRLVWERPILLADRAAIMNHVLEDQWAAALDVARDLLAPEDDAIAAIDEANEEAARAYDERDGVAAEVEERAMVVPSCSPDEPAAVKVWRARAAILQEERDAARAELAAAKKKLQGIMYGGKRRRK